jgi:hypothetical protein
MMFDTDINSFYPYTLPNKTIGGHSFNAKYWPHVKMLSWIQVHEAERWCYANFKSGNWRSRALHFAFKREQDYMLFLLRWSQ